MAEKAYGTELATCAPILCKQAKLSIQIGYTFLLFFQQILHTKETMLKTINKAIRSENNRNIVEEFMHQVILPMYQFENSQNQQVLGEDIVTKLKRFMQQFEVQVQQLTAENAKLESRYQNVQLKYQKSHMGYQKRCREAVEAIGNVEEMPEFGPDGVGLIWDTKLATHKLHSKLRHALEEVVKAKNKYQKGIQEYNEAKVEYVELRHDNLHGFQLIEEQRISFVKQILQIFMMMELNLAKCAVDTFRAKEGARKGPAAKKHVQVDTSSRGKEIRSVTSTIMDRIKALHAEVETQAALTDFTLHFSEVWSDACHNYGLGLRKIVKSHEQAQFTSVLSISSTTPLWEEYAHSIKGAYRELCDALESMSETYMHFAKEINKHARTKLSKAREELEQEASKLTLETNFATQLVLKHIAAYERIYLKYMHKTKELRQADIALDTLQKQMANEKDTGTNTIFGSLTDSPMQKQTKLQNKAAQVRMEVEMMHDEVKKREDEMQEHFIEFQKNTNSFIDRFQNLEVRRFDALIQSIDLLTTARCEVAVNFTSRLQTSETKFEEINPTQDIQHIIEVNKTSKMKISNVQFEPFSSQRLQEYLAAKSKIKPNDSTDVHGIRNAEVVLSNTSIADAKQVNVESDACADIELAPKETDMHTTFKLPMSEQFVANYTCALYLNSFPYHGRLYLTTSYVCFTGWMDAYQVIPLENVRRIEKKSTAIVMPNAIEVETSENAIYYFASFLYRDDCYQCVHQLWSIKKQINSILSGNEVDLQESSLVDEDAVAMKEYGSDLLMEPIELPYSVDAIFKRFWNNDKFLVEYLQGNGDTNVKVSSWNIKEVAHKPFMTEELFHAERSVTYIHHKKYFVGPSEIPTSQTQRYKYDHETGYLVIGMTTTVSEVMYHDYFRVEIRYSFIPTNKGCTLRVGTFVNFIKSTWVKKQIESATISETKEAVKCWVNAIQNADDANQHVKTEPCAKLDTSMQSQQKIVLPRDNTRIYLTIGMLLMFGWMIRFEYRMYEMEARVLKSNVDRSVP